MKKLTVLVAVILIAGLLAGCGVTSESRLWKIEVEPIEVNIGYTGDSEQLKVTAYYDDGTSADVTSECDYITSAEAYSEVVVSVSAEGLVTGIQTGWTTILVSYTQRNFWTSITRTYEVAVHVRFNR
ncbi:hypothetical protein ES705_21674 [subsurface metagenome]